MKEKINKDQFLDIAKDNAIVMIGGFLANGTPERLIDLLVDSNVVDLTLICNDACYEDRGPGKLIANHQVKKLITSYVGNNKSVSDQVNEGLLVVELVPQGTLAEKIRTGGAGLGGVLTPTGIGTLVQNGKKIIEIQGRDFLLEEPLFADIALIGGAVADKYGNLRYIQTMRNFNPVMALAAETVICDPDEIVDTLDPECVVTPHPLVDYIFEEE
ncbi:MAG TPA: CoA transferase subunit A [Bacillota bacterium]|nr:CoA transferase subunit A [Bacillota bacterium]HPJ86074.1 CoA transferase subunit A [Bacillota bacterium]HPQ62534.1 CoA transferase subunit A [Bacillota bacterium]